MRIIESHERPNTFPRIDRVSPIPIFSFVLYSFVKGAGLPYQKNIITKLQRSLQFPYNS